MATLIDDDVLHTIAIVGDAKHVGAEIVRRYGGLIDRIQLGMGDGPADTEALLDALRSAAMPNGSV